MRPFFLPGQKKGFLFSRGVYDFRTFVREPRKKVWELQHKVGMWNSNAEDDGLYWVIDSVAFAGTQLDSTVFEKNVDPVNLVSAAKVDNSWDFTFTVPGKYKVTVEGWIGTDIDSSTEQYTSDN